MRRRRFLRTAAVAGCLPLVGCEADLGGALGPSPAWTRSTGNGWMPKPVVAGDAVYAGGHDKAVHAFGRDGTRRWRVETGGAINRLFGATDRHVVVGSDDGDTYGLRRTTGDRTWVDQGIEALDAATVAGGTAYYPEIRLQGGSALVARGADRGDRLWERDFAGEVVGDRLTVTGGSVVARTRDGDGDATALHVIDRSTGEPRWRTSRSDIREVTAGSGVVLAVVRADPDENVEPRMTLHAFDSDTGDRRWQRTFGGIDRRPVVTQGRAFVPADRGFLTLDATTGQRRWRVPFDGGWPTSPAVSDGTVYVAGRTPDDSRAVAARSLDGTERWRVTVDARGAGGGGVGRLAVAGDAVYLLDDDVYAFAAADGARRWTYDPDGSVQWTAADDGVYGGRSDGTLIAIRPG